MKIRTSLKAILLLAGALFLLFNPVSSKADTITYELGAANTAISPFQGPYAELEVDLNSTGTTATITFTSLTQNGNIYLLGGNKALGLNVTGSFTAGSIIEASNAGTNFLTPSFSYGGSGTTDGFGSFNLIMSNIDGLKNSVDLLKFTLTGDWDYASSVLANNTDGYLAAAHIWVLSYPADRADGALATGYVAVPEPGILILLGLSMTAIGIASRYVRKI